MDLELLLKNLSDEFYKILKYNLVGIYIHGSIAFNCFRWDKSDVDFIVVVNQKISTEVKLEILLLLEKLRSKAPPKGFEMSVVQLKFCKNFQYPTPYELHFSNSVLKEYLENPMTLCTDNINTDCDLASHFTVIKNRGVVLFGQPISEVFGDIAREYYVDSICLDVENAVKDVLYNVVYIVLNLCRVHAYLRENLILSKEEGSNWGLEHLPNKYESVIIESLNNYLYSDPLSLDHKLREEFCDYMLKNI